MIGILFLYFYMLNTGLMFLLVEVFLGIIFCYETFFLIFIFKKRNKDVKEHNYVKNDNQNESESVIKYILTSLCVVFILLSYLAIPRENEKNTIQYVLNYMNNRYGNGNFKIVNIVGSYHTNSFNEMPHRDGFYVTIKSDYINEIFTIRVEDSKEIVGGSIDDGFLPKYVCKYYSEEMKNIPIDLEETMYRDCEEYPSTYSRENIYYYNFKKFLAKQKINKVQKEFCEEFNVTIKIKCDYILGMEIPENFGHLPSKEDLVDFCELDTDNIEININENEYINIYEKHYYLRRLASFAKEHLNTNHEIKMNYRWGKKSGFIEIKDGNITII